MKLDFLKEKELDYMNLYASYLVETNQTEDWKWVRELVKRIGIESFNYFVSWGGLDNKQISFIDLDKASVLYSVLFI